MTQLAEKNGEEPKIFLSPVSASYALSMAANGADGTTLRELTDALGFSGFSIDEINAYNQKLVKELVQQDNTTILSMANSLWMFDDFQVLDSYSEALNTNYDAEVRQQERMGAMEAINNWCSAKTNGCISDFLKKEPDDALVMLLNALYFKGLWVSPFDKADTRTEAFTNEGGSISQVSMMRQENRYQFAQNDMYAVVRLPYGNGAFGLQVLLPQEGVELSQCIAALDGTNWKMAQEAFAWEQVDVKLPKFTIKDCQNSLKEVLQAMGVQEAFLNIANFSKMAEKELKISSIAQSIYFSLDEEGTEAAAVTGIGTDSALLPSRPDGVYEFYVNRPFLFLLTEKSTGSVLFMGKVTKL